jgi:hypothetical protein
MEVDYFKPVLTHTGGVNKIHFCIVADHSRAGCAHWLGIGFYTCYTKKSKMH